MMIVALVGACAFVVVVCTRFGSNLIARVHAAFLIGVLGVLPVHVARLKILVLACRGGLLVARINTASIAIATLDVFALTRITVIALCASRPVGFAMVCKRVQLESVMLLKFMAQLALCVSSSLVELMATMCAIVQLSITD